MNVVTRGIKNATRSPIKSGAIILMFAISIALILSMLVARGSVLAKINEVKATAGTTVTVRPAGVMGFQGGGDPLTADQVSTITNTAHITTVSATLSDQLGTTDTNLVSSLELGAFGQRQQRFESSGSPEASSSRPAQTPRLTLTGTTDVNSVSTDGTPLKMTSGDTIDATSGNRDALVGTTLATKNNLSVGSTFTAYGSTITVKGIFDTGNTFQNSGVIMPLKTVQTLTNQAGAVSSVIATVDSSDNVSGTVTNLKTTLGDKADITSDIQRAATSVASLQGIADLALAGVIGAAIAGAVIILLAMIMIVRERRREIGVIKAIGGTNAKVIAQFTIEGLTLTIIGAVLGIILGILVSGPMTTSLVSSGNSTNNSQQQGRGTRSPTGTGVQQAFRGGFQQINTNLTQVSASLTPQILLSAIGITLLIAIIGSAVPAWFTARIRPAEVLRSE